MSRISSSVLSRLSTLMLAVAALAGSGIVSGQSVVPETVERNRAKLRECIERYWRFELEQSPFLASDHGVREADGRFPEEGPVVRERRTAAEHQFDKELNGLDLTGLDEQEKLDVELLSRELSNRLDDFRLGGAMMPISQRDGPQIWMPTIADRMTLVRPKDFRNYLRRLEGIPAYIEGTIALMEMGVERGYLAPLVTQDGVLDQFDQHLVSDLGKSRFYAPFEVFPPSVPAAEHDALRTDARAVIEGQVLPAFRRLREYLAEEYIPVCRPSIGALDLPNGDIYYQHQVQVFTTTFLTPSDIHQLGKEEVARIRAAMEARIAEIGFEGDFAAFVEHLRKDPIFYHDSAEELLRGYRDICKRVDAELPRFFGRLPRAPYGVKEIPAYEAPRATTAYYQPAPPDGARPGWFYANTYGLRSRPKYEMVALALHEAVPGHHLQIALANELEGRPEFRKTMGFTAFVEGWALYAESLGTEMGLYTDPYSDFGRLSYEMWRALRLVVDTGIHQLGWPREEAIEFMAANSALSRENIEAEVDRYISWPGQALAYKVGELRIRDLRRRAEKAHGEDFDLRAFHDHLLSAGALPLDVLERRMQEWIDAWQAAPGR